MGSDPIDLIDPRKQPAYNTIQRPPVGGHDVQQDSTIRGHGKSLSYKLEVRSYAATLISNRTFRPPPARFSSTLPPAPARLMSNSVNHVHQHSEKLFFSFSSPIRIRFIRSHRPHAAPNKYRGFREVSLLALDIQQAI